MRVRFDDLSDGGLAVLVQLLGEPEVCLRWLTGALRCEQIARATGRHIEPVESPEHDLESISYFLRHAGAGLQAFIDLHVNEDRRGPYSEALDFLARILGEDLAMHLPGSGRLN